MAQNAHPVPDPILAALRSAHSGLNLLHKKIETDDDEEHYYAIVAIDNRSGEWRRFKQASSDPQKRSGAAEALFRSCCVWAQGATTTERPEVTRAVDEMLARRPAIADTFGNRTAELLGLDSEAEAKKL